MPEIGQTISHYRIVEKIGQGGMGEVYLADDTTLDRKVALKFLPEAFTSDPERMARFEREAKLLASLNHPNIAGIYGLEQVNRNRFLALEYVEGETLQARLSKGALSLEDALLLCRQIAEGLEAAHEKGVIHRDLKPANVMITAEEKVKILDFGLAKAISDETQSIDSSQSPTLTAAMTRPGVILGTAAYMSPEQAKGKSVDKRADIWAFGCILYECLTGKKAFGGETVTETLAAVIKEEPDIEKVPAKTRLLIGQCLTKDRKNRLRDIGDAMAWIESTPENAPDSIPKRQSKVSWIWAIISTLLLVFFVGFHFHASETAEITQFQEHTPPIVNEASIAVSPNGRFLAYAAIPYNDSVSYLYVREMDSVAPIQPLNGTEGAFAPFWSPDNRHVGFSAGNKLKIIDITGGAPRDICSAGLFNGGTWNRNDLILFGDYPVLRSVSVKTGEMSTIRTTNEEPSQMAYNSPCFLPNGKDYLYTESIGTLGSSSIYLGSLESKEKKLLIPRGLRPVYAETGHLIFQRDRTLYVQSFNIKRQELTGEPIPIADNMLIHQIGGAPFSVSQDDILIYRASQNQSLSQFVWVDRNGNEQETVGDPAWYRSAFDLSLDGKNIVAIKTNSTNLNDEVWLIEWARDASTLIVPDAGGVDNVVWGPDGLIGYSASLQESPNIYQINSSGLGGVTTLLDSPENEWIEDWSKNNQYILYTCGQVGSSNICVLPLSGDQKVFSILPSSFRQDEPHLSFDEKWLAYISDDSNSWQVYVTSFPEPDRKRLVSTNETGGSQPRWRQDGKELYYVSLDGKMMAVDFNKDTGEPGSPHELFNTGLTVVDPIRDQYAVTADGQRFLLLKTLTETTTTPITVTLNWTSLIDK